MTAPGLPEKTRPGPVVIRNCAIATMDGRQHDESGSEYRSGHIVVSGGRIAARWDAQKATKIIP